MAMGCPHCHRAKCQGQCLKYVKPGGITWQDAMILNSIGGFGNGNRGTVAAPHGSTGTPRSLSPGAAFAAALAHHNTSRASKPLQSAGITVGEFVGWRIWKVRRADRLLESYSQDRVWLPGEPMQGKPSDHGSEGVWAFKEGYHAAAKAKESEAAIFHWGKKVEAWALGTVWLWGNVVEHSIGYRGEYAEVRSLDWVNLRCASMEPSAAAPAAVRIINFRSGDRSIAMYPCDDDLLARMRERYRVGSDMDATNGKRAGPRD